MAKVFKNCTSKNSLSNFLLFVCFFRGSQLVGLVVLRGLCGIKHQNQVSSIQSIIELSYLAYCALFLPHPHFLFILLLEFHSVMLRSQTVLRLKLRPPVCKLHTWYIESLCHSIVLLQHIFTIMSDCSILNSVFLLENPPLTCTKRCPRWL